MVGSGADRKGSGAERRFRFAAAAEGKRKSGKKQREKAFEP